MSINTSTERAYMPTSQNSDNQISLAVDNTKSRTEGLLYHCDLNEEDKHKIDMIIQYVDKYPKMFQEYRVLYHEIFIKGVKSMKLRHDVNKYVNDFFRMIESKTKIGIKYEKILGIDGEIYFQESLLRINTDNDFNHIDLLKIYNTFGKSIYIFFNILKRIFEDIESGEINGSISINVETKDIEHPNFIRIIKHLQKLYNVDFSKNKMIFEILENYKLPDTPLFKEKVQELKDLGIDIALDDNVSDKVSIEDTLNNINSISDDLDILKLDGKTIKSFYNIYKTAYNIFNDGFLKLKNILESISNKGIKIIAEWIEDMDILNFAKDILGISYFQGYFSDNPDNIKLLTNKK